jgi:hypothetical protein
MKGNLKIGDFVVCDSQHTITGIGYGKVIKLFDITSKLEVESYENIITGRGDKNSKLEITVKLIGYDFTHTETALSDIVEHDGGTRILDPHQVYRVITEENISDIKDNWEIMMTTKLDFFYKHINKEPLEGRKSLNTLKIK